MKLIEKGISWPLPTRGKRCKMRGGSDHVSSPYARLEREEHAMSVRSPARRAGFAFNSSRGFSLVEILVVLGIVGLLIAILLPSITRARDQANRTRCLNNIRQIGMAVLYYAHDHKDYPAPDERLSSGSLATVSKGMVVVATRRTGLLALPQRHDFRRESLTCPEGWASNGNDSFYQADGINKDGLAYMDYAYWGGRFGPPAKGFDPKYASLAFKPAEKATKILITDAVADQSSQTVRSIVGTGNHGVNHRGPPQLVTQTSGNGRRLETNSVISGRGMSVFFSDGHTDWFNVERLTQQFNGLCYPPADQW
jgi:prepilin-type N-terminal cleavage/methylation domain-containing protein